MTFTTIAELVRDLAHKGPLPEPQDEEPRNLLWTALQNLMARSPIPPHDMLQNLGLWHPHIYDARFLSLAELYRQHIVNTDGTIIEFGVRYGQDLAWLVKLRGLLEPLSQRTIIGFDTFAGHKGSSEIDGDDWMVQDGAFDVPEHYDSYLTMLLATHAYGMSMRGEQQMMPVFLVTGDVRDSLPDALENQFTHLIVAAAVFDLDLYEPTKAVLEYIVPRLHRGSLLVFDELDAMRMPGETHALLDTVGLGRLKLERFPWDHISYAVYE